jgi:hypothetical protein
VRRLALLAAIVLVFPGLARADSFALELSSEGEGHPSAYSWEIRSPTGEVTSLDGQTVSVVIDDSGTWRFRSYVYYLHGNPLAPGLWVAIDTAHWPEPLFADGFESGSTEAWTTQGGPL